MKAKEYADKYRNFDNKRLAAINIANSLLIESAVLMVGVLREMNDKWKAISRSLPDLPLKKNGFISYLKFKFPEIMDDFEKEII